MAWSFFRRDNITRPKVVIRTNVLVLIGLGYFVIFGIFVLILLNIREIEGLEAADVIEAYDHIKEPLMVLIGGSLAIIKDLIPTTDSPSDGDEYPMVGPSPTQEEQERN